ncbi:LysR substrate-binding domain-containing protein, partial [Castellaniella sp.]
HGLRSTLASAVRRQAVKLEVALEIDSLAMLMDAVAAGLVATIQPGAAITRMAGHDLAMARLSDPGLVRRNLLASLSDEELSPAGLAVRVALRDVVRGLVESGQWLGARSLHES